MKTINYLLGFILFLYSCTAFSQSNYFKNGDTWYYKYSEPDLGYSYVTYTVLKDTLINGKTAKELEYKSFNFKGLPKDSSIFYLYEENRRVYRLNEDEFELMYDFNLEVGDTLQVQVDTLGCASVSPIIVESVEMEEFDGVPLKKLHLYYIIYGVQGDEIRKVNLEIIERIGNLANFLPHWSCEIACNLGDYFLSCYISSDINYHKYNDVECDEYDLVKVKDYSKNYNIIVYPNPAEDVFFIENKTDKKEDIEIINFHGQVLYSINLDAFSKARISAKDLGTKGIFLIFNKDKFVDKVIVK